MSAVSNARDGDRSHPELVRLDRIKQRLSYPGWQGDFNETESIHFGDRRSILGSFDDHIFKLEEKQRVFQGDRSHSRLVLLDAHSSSYPGWRTDAKKAEEKHYLSQCSVALVGFNELLGAMRNKQQLHSLGRTHPDLVRLDALKPSLSYSGWEADVEEAERIHLGNRQSIFGSFDDYLFKMEEQQRVHEGDRSHERLVELDSHNFSYPGWRADFREAEEKHYMSHCCIVLTGFNVLLQEMKNKQHQHSNGRTHPDLVRLDILKPSLSYTDWETDFQEAEDIHFGNRNTIVGSFDDFLLKMEEKQRVFEGDRSHERLVELDSHNFSYPGWQKDFKMAEEKHCMAQCHYSLIGFNTLLQEMKNKQQAYQGARSQKPNDDKKRKRQPESSSPGSDCVICLSSPKTHAFIPCGHLCACESCADRAIERSESCPLCRKKCIMVTQIFN